MPDQPQPDPIRDNAARVTDFANAHRPPDVLLDRATDAVEMPNPIKVARTRPDHRRDHPHRVGPMTAARSTTPAELPTPEEVDEAIRSDDREKMLVLRDTFRSPDLFTAEAAMLASDALSRLRVALTMPDDAPGPQTGSKRPLNDRVADARAALRAQMPDDGVTRRRAAEVKARMKARAAS